MRLAVVRATEEPRRLSRRPVKERLEKPHAAAKTVHPSHIYSLARRMFHTSTCAGDWLELHVPMLQSLSADRGPSDPLRGQAYASLDLPRDPPRAHIHHRGG